jgi:hypothetical protein
VDGIDVGDHAGRRLGLAHGDDVAGGEPVQDVDVARVADGLRGLGEDVVGVGVAGVGQVAVPLGIPPLERPDLDPGDRQHPAALDARALRGHADVGRAMLQQLGVRQAKVGVAVDAGGDVEPLDEHGPVERPRVRRPPHQDARPVRRRARLGDRPAPVLAQVTDGPVGGRIALDDVLLLDVPVALGQTLRHGVERLVVRSPRDGTGHDRAGHCGAGHRTRGLLPRPRVPGIVVIARGSARRARRPRHQHPDERHDHQGLRRRAGARASLVHPVSPPAGATSMSNIGVNPLRGCRQCGP